MTHTDIVVRPAAADDVPLIFSFIRELAEYERMSDQVAADEVRLRQTLFGARPAAEVLIAAIDRTPVGFALFFQNYSTFLGKPGIYLEDLFVRPQWRGRGAGRALLMQIARLARQRGCGRVEWAVLDWNEPAIGFYTALGAKPMADWTVFRLSGEALEQFAAK
jgi:GNAT superfamily N-acetyltransferase